MRNTSSCQEIAAYGNMSVMEIAYLGNDSLRIKGKQGALVLDPVNSKAEADAVLFSTKNPQKLTFSGLGSRLTIAGPGEYEVAGIKVSTTISDVSLIHTIKVDNVTVVVGDSAAISKVHDKLSEPHIVVAKATDGALSSAVTALAPRVVVLYGEKAKTEAKSLGKEDVKEVNKHVTTLEKLPADLEVIVFG